jgi:N-acetylglucosaminyl-diphospho-decaprenol L-rhamnosyltransferase
VAIHHAQSKILFTWKHAGAPSGRPAPSPGVAALGLNVLARIVVLSPKHLARAWGRFQGLRVLKAGELASARREAR